MSDNFFFSPCNWAPQESEDIIYDSLGLAMAERRHDPRTYPCSAYGISLTSSWFAQQQPSHEDASIIIMHSVCMKERVNKESFELREVGESWRTRSYGFRNEEEW